MSFFVTCSLRRWALRSWWTVILVLGLCQAAKVNKAVYYDLPHDPIHWNRHLTMVRSLLGTQSLSLKYVPIGGSISTQGPAPTEKLASTEDFFGAVEYVKPATIPQDTWNELTRIIFTTIFMGIGVNFKWLTSKVPFGDAKALIDRLKQHVGNKDAQIARLTTRW